MDPEGSCLSLENHKTIGFLSNTGPDPLENHKTGLDPLENHKTIKPAFNVGPLSAHQGNTIYAI